MGDKAPASNSGKFEAKGYEGTLTWSDKIGKVNYHIGGTLHTRIIIGRLRRSNSFQIRIYRQATRIFPKFSVWIEVTAERFRQRNNCVNININTTTETGLVFRAIFVWEIICMKM